MHIHIGQVADGQAPHAEAHGEAGRALGQDPLREARRAEGARPPEAPADRHLHVQDLCYRGGEADRQDSGGEELGQPLLISRRGV